MKKTSTKITLLLLFAVSLFFAGCATPLMNAAQRGDTKEMERLITAGADVNKRIGSFPFTALFTAVEHGHVEAVRLLIKSGADINAKNSWGWTPLHFVGNVEVARVLIENGADVNVRGNRGETPLDNAMLRHKDDVVRLFERAKRGAFKRDPNDPAEEAAFSEAAAKYRAAAVTPALPEEARRSKVQAESAFEKKDFDNAAARYKDALQAAPWWPEGHFNRALILGELHRYHDAIKEMKRYLTLVPEAANARAAQDKIYQWEGEIGQQP